MPNRYPTGATPDGSGPGMVFGVAAARPWRRACSCAGYVSVHLYLLTRDGRLAYSRRVPIYAIRIAEKISKYCEPLSVLLIMVLMIEG